MKYNYIIIKNSINKKYIKYALIFLIVFFFNLYYEVNSTEFIEFKTLLNIFGYQGLNEIGILALIYKIINILFIIFCTIYIYTYDITYNSCEVLIRFGKINWSFNRTIITMTLITISKFISYTIFALFVGLDNMIIILKDMLFTYLLIISLIGYLNIKLNNNKLNIYYMVIFVALSLLYLMYENLMNISLIFYILTLLILIVLKELSLRYESQKD